MNLLTFYPAELDEQRQLAVSGRRARHLREVLGVTVGSELRVGQLDGGIGRARVIAIENDDVQLEIVHLNVAVPEPQIELVVAIPRPQTLKKVLELLGVMGVRRLSLIASARVEKSYFDTLVLRPEALESQLRLGCEQGVNTYLPRVEVHKNFRRFMSEVFDEVFEEVCDETASTRLLADPYASKAIWDRAQRRSLSKAKGVCLAIGPEGGWTQPEVEEFEKHGFLPLRFSERILRVEHAVCATLAQLEMLQRIGGNEFDG